MRQRGRATNVRASERTNRRCMLRQDTRHDKRRGGPKGKKMHGQVKGSTRTAKGETRRKEKGGKAEKEQIKGNGRGETQRERKERPGREGRTVTAAYLA